MKQNLVYFLKKFLFYFIIGVCTSGLAIFFSFPFVIVAAVVCATIATMNRSDKIFTKHFWFAVAILTILWVIFLIFQFFVWRV